MKTKTLARTNEGSLFVINALLLLTGSLLILATGTFFNDLKIYKKSLETQFIEKIEESNSQTLANYPLQEGVFE